MHTDCEAEANGNPILLCPAPGYPPPPLPRPLSLSKGLVEYVPGTCFRYNIAAGGIKGSRLGLSGKTEGPSNYLGFSSAKSLSQAKKQVPG